MPQLSVLCSAHHKFSYRASKPFLEYVLWNVLHHHDPVGHPVSVTALFRASPPSSQPPFPTRSSHSTWQGEPGTQNREGYKHPCPAQLVRCDLHLFQYTRQGATFMLVFTMPLPFLEMPGKYLPDPSLSLRCSSNPAFSMRVLWLGHLRLTFLQLPVQ